MTLLKVEEAAGGVCGRFSRQEDVAGSGLSLELVRRRFLADEGVRKDAVPLQWDSVRCRGDTTLSMLPRVREKWPLEFLLISLLPTSCVSAKLGGCSKGWGILVPQACHAA